MATEALSVEFRDGTYKCAKCGEILYLSGDKFQSIDKYPAFRKPAESNSVNYVTGDFGTEDIECNKCGNHIGQLFHDGKKSGDDHPDAKDRHCVESASLTFEASNPDQEAPVLAAPSARLTLNVSESTEKPTSSPLGSPQPKTKLRSSKPNYQQPSAHTKPTAASSKPTRTRTPPPTSELAEEVTGPSKTLMGVVAVAAVAIIGLGGYLGWRRMSNQKK